MSDTNFIPAATNETNHVEKPTAEEVVRLLGTVDWNHYWQSITENSSKEIEAYRSARASYLASASRRVLI